MPGVVFPAPQQQDEVNLTSPKQPLFYPQASQDERTMEAPEGSAAANGEPPSVIETPVLICGGGPVGMLLGLMLGRLHGQSCTIIEQAPDTSIYPKMEYSNARSMEIYRMMNFAEGLRKVCVDPSYDLVELWSTGLGEKGEKLCNWQREGPNEYRARSLRDNDGSQSCEGPMRGIQPVVEKFLKEEVLKEGKVTGLWGHRLLNMEETVDNVVAEVLNVQTGKAVKFKAKYLVGTDGAGSLVRHLMGVEAPRRALDLLIAFAHFRSRDPKIRRFGRFWHGNVLMGGVFVDQNEDDLQTVHYICPPGADPAELLADPQSIIELGAGGITGRTPIQVDEMLCTGVWKAQVAVADKFRSTGGRVMLAGDSAHQYSPVGGHGLNTGVGDAFDLAWKLAAVVQGWGGATLLQSYDAERRPVCIRNQEMVEKAVNEVVIPVMGFPMKIGIETFLSDTPEGQAGRNEVSKLLDQGYWIHNQEGVTLGQRYTSDMIVERDPKDQEPALRIQEYYPTTWPGARVPHVWKTDGKSIVDDLSTSGFTLVDFTASGTVADTFVTTSRETGVPLIKLHIPNETRVHELWAKDVVLVRPDGFSAFRINGAITQDDAIRVLRKVSGHDK